MKKIKKKSSKKRARTLKKNAKRLAAYSAAAAATVTVTGTANAQEVIWNIPDTSVAGNGVHFNMVTGSYNLAPDIFYYSTQGLLRVGQFFSSGYPIIYGPANSTGAGFVGPGGFIESYFYPDVMASSDNVGARKEFGAATYYIANYGYYGWLSNFTGPTGFVGVRFTLGTDTHYGWVYVAGTGSGMTLNAFGYESAAGFPSKIPDENSIPEPSSMALLALGAAGLGAWRRRRAAA